MARMRPRKRIDPAMAHMMMLVVVIPETESQTRGQGKRRMGKGQVYSIRPNPLLSNTHTKGFTKCKKSQQQHVKHKTPMTKGWISEQRAK